MATTVRKAVLPVAGMGTRFLPASKAVPKVMLPVVDKPLNSIRGRRGAGGGDRADRLRHRAGRGGNQGPLRARRRARRVPRGARRRYRPGCRRERRARSWHRFVCAPEATAGPGPCRPLRARIWWANEPFAVLLPDELLLGDPPPLAELVEVYRRTGRSVVALTEVPPDETGRYGIVEVAGEEGANHHHIRHGGKTYPRERARLGSRSSAATSCIRASSRGFRCRGRARAARYS